MKRTARIFMVGSAMALALAALVQLGMYLSTPGYCFICPSYKCFGPGSCGYGCSCVTIGGEVGGRCISVERK